MALGAAGTLTNIYFALDRRFDEVAALGYPVQYHGQRRFVPPTTGAWIRVRYDLVPLTRRFVRHVSPTELGDEIQGTVEVTLAEHARVYMQRYTLAAARDAIVALFPPSGMVPIRESAADDTPQIGVLYLETLSERLLDDASESGLIQHSLSITVRYVETYPIPA